MSKSTSMRCGAILLGLFALAAGPSSVPQEVKALYDRQEYQKVID
jgi:hypothetical protein